jgi:hypothetical protein
VYGAVSTRAAAQIVRRGSRRRLSSFFIRKPCYLCGMAAVARRSLVMLYRIPTHFDTASF